MCDCKSKYIQDLLDITVPSATIVAEDTPRFSRDTNEKLKHNLMSQPVVSSHTKCMYTLTMRLALCDGRV